MLVKRSPDLKYSDITPRDIYVNRRKFLYGMGLAGGLALAGQSLASLVSPSCSHHISMSLLDTSSLLPTEANEEIPIPSLVRWSTMAKPSPPDCMTRPTEPGRALAAANVASSPIDGTATPKQYGPISRIP